MKFIAKTLKGLEGVLAQEIRDLGGLDVKKLSRAVEYEGSRTLLYKSNLQLRTALRILVPLFQFNAKDENELYDKVYAYDWCSLIPVDKTFAIDFTVNSATFTHSQYISLKTKDAIVDKIRNKKGVRPDVHPSDPDIQLNLHIRDQHVDISLDSSGDSLHKRGYRTKEVDAPINEVLAAGLVLLSGWKADIPLMDPMCGSGTILVEAARFAKNIPPQNLDRNFNFKRWLDFDETLWERVLEQIKDEKKHRSVEIYGSDINKYNARVAEINLRTAGLSRSIKISLEDFFDTSAKFDETFIITNPPYDYRLKSDNIYDFYMKMGYAFKQEYPNTEAWILSGNIEALDNMGLPCEKSINLMNGGMDAVFNQYKHYNK